MGKSLIWDSEDAQRQEEIAEWFESATGITRTDSFEEYIERIKDILQKKLDGEFLTDEQKDLINFFKGEINQDGLVTESFELIKGKQRKEQEELKEELAEKKEFQEIEDREYKRAEQYSIGYIKGVAVRVYLEEYIFKGEKKYRARQIGTGYLASMVNPD